MPKTYPAPQPFADGPAPVIAMDSVDGSTQIAAIGHDEATQTLAVMFTRGFALYHYPNVPRATYEAFKAAESPGTFFAENVKHLPFTKYRIEPQVETATTEAQS